MGRRDWGGQSRFGLLRREGITRVLPQINHRHHRPFQPPFGPLRVAVVDPVQPVGVTATFLGNGTIDHRNPGAVVGDDLANQGLVDAF